MTNYVIDQPRIVALPVIGTSRLYPVRRIYCIGRNYAAHTVEMGGDPNREEPFFFQKNPQNLDPSGEFPYPAHTSNVHHEAELSVMLASGGTGIPVDRALDHVFGYALSIDMTRRDLQAVQKQRRRPWEIAKAFERSAPVGPVHPVAKVGHFPTGDITLSVNGELRQEGNLDQMIWKVPEIISYLSEYFALAGGDVILTGTPSGVAAVEKGDQIEMSVDGLGSFEVRVI